eukprot:7156465-Pyramimonas_sp.AAC.1
MGEQTIEDIKRAKKDIDSARTAVTKKPAASDGSLIKRPAAAGKVGEDQEEEDDEEDRVLRRPAVSATGDEKGEDSEDQEDEDEDEAEIDEEEA